jgi:formylglycine-generating enzyme required for sulfatase activity
MAQDTFKEFDKCPELVVVPAASFTRGSPANGRERRSDEGPPHRLTIRQAFAVGKLAAFEAWDACAADCGCRMVFSGTRREQSPRILWGSVRRATVSFRRKRPISGSKEDEKDPINTKIDGGRCRD